ncbi:Aluminum-activated malate transporter 2-like protein [Drosera capensis]
MDISPLSFEKVEGEATGFMSRWLNGLAEALCGSVVGVVVMSRRIAMEDPRRVIHAFKVALAISIVSLFYYIHPLYHGLGVSTMWAVLTVVVVFEFSVGATLGKGINRMIATLLAGFLGASAHQIADSSGKIGEPILLGVFVFLIATIVTFMRFFPRLKARYDYGLMVFILTFSLVSVSSYRVDEILKVAEQRLSTIIVGSCIAMLECICICPVWMGTELHNLIANNIDKLGCFLEGFGGEYFDVSDDGMTKDNNSFLHMYNSVLASKGQEENMANLARWEPGHGKFRFNHPWKQYLKVGTLARQCAYKIDTLSNYLNSDVQASPEIKRSIQDACIKLSSETGKALKELSLTMKKMRRSYHATAHISRSKAAAEELKSLLKASAWEEFNLIDVLPAATVASLLIDIVACTENIAESVHELASLAKFKSNDKLVVPDQPDLEDPGNEYRPSTLQDLIAMSR